MKKKKFFVSFAVFDLFCQVCFAASDFYDSQLIKMTWPK